MYKKGSPPGLPCQDTSDEKDLPHKFRSELKVAAVVGGTGAPEASVHGVAVGQIGASPDHVQIRMVEQVERLRAKLQR